MSFRTWIYLFSILVLCSNAVMAETNIQQALNEANRGEKDQAIRDLEELSRKSPNDGQVALSLGLMYQSTDQNDKAILQLEKAVAIDPKPHGYFALGMLYEDKLISTKDPGWRQKAIQAWDEFLRVASFDNQHRPIAEKHLQRLRNNG